MRVFVAGGTGVIGTRLIPQLVTRGHEVTATTSNPGKVGLLEQLGAESLVMDGLDAASVGEAVALARPDTIVHQMTAISVAHAGKPDLKHIDRWFATTIRLRTEGTDHLLAAIAAPFLQIGGTVAPHEVNGQAGAIFRDRDNKVVNALVLEILDGQIQTIRSVINPDKLRHVGPVADAWAVVREATAVRRTDSDRS